MPDFSKRSGKAEIMDSLQSFGPDWEQALRELNTINRLLGGYRLSLKALDKLLEGQTINSTLRIADVGCGRGDMLLVLARHLERKGIKAELIGIDANPYIIAAAKIHCAHVPEIQLECMNVFDEKISELRVDIFCNTLFMHHFSDPQVIRLCRVFSTHAGMGFFINDLHRHPLAYHSISLLTALFSRSKMVQNDARLSVLRAFRRADWELFAKHIPLTGLHITWHWAFRWMVIWRR
jgi:2-polyprenyl-3-methyl-5-hydroxy-6-metoxy-1,4-benzoquinol methylase